MATLGRAAVGDEEGHDEGMTTEVSAYEMAWDHILQFHRPYGRSVNPLACEHWHSQKPPCMPHLSSSSTLR